MRRLLLVATAVFWLTEPAIARDLITYNSGYPEANEQARESFFRAVNITQPQYRVDFEQGFSDEQNIDLTPRMEPIFKLELGLSQRQPRSFAEA